MFLAKASQSPPRKGPPFFVVFSPNSCNLLLPNQASCHSGKHLLQSNPTPGFLPPPKFDYPLSSNPYSPDTPWSEGNSNPYPLSLGRALSLPHTHTHTPIPTLTLPHHFLHSPPSPRHGLRRRRAALLPVLPTAPLRHVVRRQRTRSRHRHRHQLQSGPIVRSPKPTVASSRPQPCKFSSLWYLFFYPQFCELNCRVIMNFSFFLFSAPSTHKTRCSPFRASLKHTWIMKLHHVNTTKTWTIITQCTSMWKAPRVFLYHVCWLCLVDCIIKCFAFRFCRAHIVLPYTLPNRGSLLSLFNPSPSRSNLIFYKYSINKINVFFCPHQII